MGEAQRFTLDTARIIPKWGLVVWDVSVVLIAVVNTVVLALQLNPASLLFPAFGIVMIGFLHVMARGFQNPDWNFVELADNSLRVSISVMFRPLSVEFPYWTVERVEQHQRHRFWQGLLGYWPYYPTRDHVDVRLQRSRFILVGWGRALPWVKTVHLQVMETERFAAELRERLASASASEPGGP